MYSVASHASATVCSLFELRRVLVREEDLIVVDDECCVVLLTALPLAFLDHLLADRMEAIDVVIVVVGEHVAIPLLDDLESAARRLTVDATCHVTPPARAEGDQYGLMSCSMCSTVVRSRSDSATHSLVRMSSATSRTRESMKRLWRRCEWTPECCLNHGAERHGRRASHHG